MEINQIETLLNEIEQNARAKIVEINGVYILKDDEPKYRALLALKEFLGKNESVIRELNTLAKAAGVETSQIISTFAVGDVMAQEHIPVGISDPVLNARPEDVPVVNIPLDGDAVNDLKKKSELGAQGTQSVVSENVGEEIIPDIPNESIDLSSGDVDLTLGGEGELPKRSSVMPEGGIDPMTEWPSPLAAPEDTESSKFVYHPMSDEEIAQAVQNIQGTFPKKNEPEVGAPAETEAPAPAPEEAEPTQTPTELTLAGPNKRKKVVSRRLHSWKDNFSKGLCVVGALLFGENLSYASQSYRDINMKIGYIRSELCKKNPIDEANVEQVHNDIVNASDLTPSEKRKLYKKLGRLDKAIERFNKRNGESRGRK